MRISQGRLLALVLIALLGTGLGLLAHEEQDPVCGMMVAIEDARWTFDYMGKKYYFCNAEDLELFKATPEKYVSALREVKVFKDVGLVVTTRPKEPKVGRLAKCTMKVGPLLESGIGPDESSPLKIRNGVVRVYLADRTREPACSTLVLHPLSEPGVYGFSVQVKDPGPHHVYLKVELEDGRSFSTAFEFTAVSEPDPHDGGGLPIAKDKISMEDQHATMKHIGRLWTEIWESLEGGGVSRPGLARRVRDLRDLQGNLRLFSLHKFAERKDEFETLAGEFGDRLKELDRVAGREDAQEIRRAFRQIDLHSCTQCHLLFRWGVVEDLSRFPDVEDAEPKR